MDFSDSANSHSYTVTDQMGNKVQLSGIPSRIISLVPSQTELLFDLGLAEKIVGVTKFCIHPREQVKGKPKVGGTKNFNLDLIRRLKPDLIIGNKEENYAAGIIALQQQFPVWMSDIQVLTDALDMMRSIGTITGTGLKAETLINTIDAAFSQLVAGCALPTAYFIWKQPYLAVGSHTFIHDIMIRAGFQNVFAALRRYPEVTPEMLHQARPQIILLSSEPYPFREKHLEEFKAICPDALVLLVDGELFSWYGSRLQLTVPYLQQLHQAVLNNR